MKQYNNERGIISLTSWKARINTVDKTLYSLIKMCPGFHIVLVLSEEEFPKKEEELPEELMLFVENDLIEILWVYKNYKAFKKVIFTSKKYPNIPIISADDDCIYICNYAEKFYQKWIDLGKKEISIRWSNWKEHQKRPSGASNFYFGLHKHFEKILNDLTDDVINKSLDDQFFETYFTENKFNCTFLTKEQKKPFIFFTDVGALTTDRNKIDNKKVKFIELK